MRRNGARNAVEGGGIGGSQEFLRALFGASLDGCLRDGRERKGDRDFKRRWVGVRGLPPFAKCAKDGAPGVGGLGWASRQANAMAVPPESRSGLVSGEFYQRGCFVTTPLLTKTRLRPARLAPYIASSASRSKVSMSMLRPFNSASPMETLTET